jgi:GNAT superfamily N-acetyltransferase
MDGLTPMLGEREFNGARCELVVCAALPERMQSRTRELIALEVPADARRRGMGRELMERVTSEADEHDITLIVMPKPFGELQTMNTHQLTHWYCRRFGFVAFQASPVILLARMPGSTPKFVSPVAGATRVLLESVATAERRK